MLEELLKKYCKKYEGMPIALSGGIDSGLLAALIKPKFAISVELPESKHNEIEWAKKVVKHLGIKEHIIVKYDENNFEGEARLAVKAIGRPIPHFNIVPLFQMYQKLAEMREKEIVLGDGPDETMCGYARDLIINYLYKIYEFEAFKNYKPLIDKILPSQEDIIYKILDKEIYQPPRTPWTTRNWELWKTFSSISEANIKLMRPDMDDMSNGIAKYFGITNHRPYQDNKEIDDYMFNLPIEKKIWRTQYGKYALRLIAEKYLPKDVAWRIVKVGGPLYSPNFKMGWIETDGEYGKKSWLDYQNAILNSS